MAIKDVLPLLRHERGMTQEELASKLFVTRQAVSRWENGDTAPNIDMTKLLAAYSKCLFRACWNCPNSPARAAACP